MRRLPVLGLALLAALGAACDWTKFDDLALKAGVRAVTRPEDMDSNVYPSVVLPVTRARGNAELLVLGADKPALADFTFGPDGHMGTQTVSNARFLLNDVKIGPLATQTLADREYTVAAYLADPSDDVPRIVTVLKAERQPLLVTLDSADANFAVVAFGDPLPFDPGAIGVGEARAPGATDVVIASSELVVLPYGSADPVQRCDLDSAVRAIAVGDQWIAVGNSDDIGQVWVLTPPYDAPGDDCPNRPNITNRTDSVGFGAAVLAADVDGDTVRELVVSAPKEKTVYVFRPDDLTVEPARYSAVGGSTSQGTSIAVGTVEGKRTLLIGDPDYVGELDSPGVVWLQDLETTGADPVPLVSPNDDDVVRFGHQVGVVTFTGPNGPVDLVWAAAEPVTRGDPGVLYLFFWAQSAASDPRVFTD
jgi:hypothetical protein